MEGVVEAVVLAPKVAVVAAAAGLAPKVVPVAAAGAAEAPNLKDMMSTIQRVGLEAEMNRSRI
jgi:hypothetical protein